MVNLSGIRKGNLFFMWTYHIVLILLPLRRRSNICVHPDLLNEDLFSWSRYSIIFISVVLVAAPIRLLAYAQLGPNFTFGLTKPSRLMTTGIYRYVKHPSYTTFFLLNCACYFFFCRTDGVAACWLPLQVVKVKGLSVAVGTLLGGLTLFGLAIRVKDEEDMMRREFGKEWEVYHNTTKRFLPGII